MCASQIGPDLFEDFLKVKRADILAQHPSVIGDKVIYLEQVERIWRDIQMVGVFALGDVRAKELRQIATAVGEGSIAGQEVYNYYQGLSEK